MTPDEERRAREELRRLLAAADGLTLAELRELDDEDLYSNLLMCVDGADSLNESQRLFYAVAAFEVDVCNGGMPLFFINHKDEQIRETRAAFEALGQTELVALLDMAISRVRFHGHLREKRDRYGDFLDASKLGELSEEGRHLALSSRPHLIAFVRAHLADFASSG